MADTDTAFGWLADHEIPADRMGVIGFDLGGTVALLVAAKRSFGAAVTVAGEGIEKSPSSSVPALVDAAPELTCPWLGIYGESADGGADRAAARGGARLASRPPTSWSTRRRATASTTTRSPAPTPGKRMLNWFDSHLR